MEISDGSQTVAKSVSWLLAGMVSHENQQNLLQLCSFGYTSLYGLSSFHWAAVESVIGHLGGIKKAASGRVGTK